MTAPRFIHLRLHSAYSLLEGAIPVKTLAELCRRRRHAGGGADRHRQPLRRARIFRNHGQGRHPADHGLPARARLRRAGPSRRPRARAARRSCCSPRTRRGFGNLMKLSSLNYLDCGAALPHVTLAQLAAHADGPDLPDRRRRGPARRPDPRRPRRRAPGRSPSASPASSPAASTSRSSATRRTAPRARRPRRRPSPASSASPTTSTCRSSPPTTSQFPAAGHLRRPRRADLHRRGRLRRPAGRRAAG